MEIEMPRGDLKCKRFPILNPDGTIASVELDEIFISFKRSTEDDEILFQKKLSDGTITKDEDNYYHFRIEPEDTDDLEYGYYPFDIEIIKINVLKQTVVGVLHLTEEVTFRKNEGD